MKTILALLLAVASTIALAREQGNAAAIGQLMQGWQSRILALNLPVEDGKNWSMRNMAKFSRLNAERLALAQRAGSLDELEIALLDAPFGSGTRLDVLLANQPGNIAMIGSRSVAKASPATTPAAYANLVFTAVTTCRIMDTRPSQGGSGPWTANSTNSVKVGPYSTAGGGYASGAGAQGGSATSCGLDNIAGPDQIAVVMAAVSTVSQAGPGYLTFFPQGAPNPGTTSVSQWYQPGYVQTSFVLIPTDLVGAVSASAFTSASTEVIIDVVGYFIANAGGTNITLVDSTATAGNITKGSSRFIHNFGVFNTFIGVSSGNFSMTGSFNTGSGTNALQSNTTGFSNTATGAAALQANTTGIQNTAIGNQALTGSTGSFNTATGMNALQSNTVGFSNTATGRNSLVFNTFGANNTAMGDRALFSSTGGGNIAVGANAGSNLTTGSSNIHIGHAGVAAETATIRIGDGSQAATFISGIRGVTTASATGIAVLIDANGQLGTVSSSRSVKDDIADMDAASSSLLKLRPVTFHYKADQSPSGRTLQYGLIAEEVDKVYPGLIAHSADGKVETVMYQFLPPMLLNEAQRQQRTIETQATHIAGLEREITEMKRQMARLAKAIER